MRPEAKEWQIKLSVTERQQDPKHMTCDKCHVTHDTSFLSSFSSFFFQIFWYQCYYLHMYGYAGVLDFVFGFLLVLLFNVYYHLFKANMLSFNFPIPCAPLTAWKVPEPLVFVLHLHPLEMKVGQSLCTSKSIN